MLTISWKSRKSYYCIGSSPSQYCNKQAVENMYLFSDNLSRRYIFGLNMNFDVESKNMSSFKEEQTKDLSENIEGSTVYPPSLIPLQT